MSPAFLGRPERKQADRKRCSFRLHPFRTRPRRCASRWIAFPPLRLSLVSKTHGNGGGMKKRLVCWFHWRRRKEARFETVFPCTFSGRTKRFRSSLSAWVEWEGSMGLREVSVTIVHAVSKTTTVTLHSFVCGRVEALLKSGVHGVDRNLQDAIYR